MGGMFVFLGSQYWFEVDGDEYFIDLLLFYCCLCLLVVIELKIGKFEFEFVGKMQFYFVVFDEQVCQDDENLFIGIILCKEKKCIIVEYVLCDVRKLIGVVIYVIIKSLLKELQDQLFLFEIIVCLFEILQLWLLKMG